MKNLTSVIWEIHGFQKKVLIKFLRESMLFWENMPKIWPRWLGNNLILASVYVYGGSKSAPWKEPHPGILSKLREFQEWIPNNSPIMILSQAYFSIGSKKPQWIHY